MEGVRTEMEASLKRMLTAEEKLNALAADVVQWNKAKSRVHYALPKAKEFYPSCHLGEGHTRNEEA